MSQPKYTSVRDYPNAPHGRWIGRCKRCKTVHRIEGRNAQGTIVYPVRNVNAPGYPDQVDFVIVATDGTVYRCADMGTNPTASHLPCGDHWVRVVRVHEGRKASKHECGARCMAATGPVCDCKCRGKNHGRG